MKTMLRKTLTTLAFALGITTFASAAEIYHNQLAGGVVVPAGTYGGITIAKDIVGVRPWTSILEIPAVSGQTSGSYVNIIKKVSKNTDVQTHTVSGWFKLTKKSNADTVLWAALSVSSSNDHGGYKVAVTKDGYLKVGKCKYSLADVSVLTSSTAVPNSQWFYLTVVITKSSSARTATVQAFVNGEAFTMPTGTFATNLNGDNCVSFQVGDSVSYAGLRIDGAAVTDTATIKGWATNATYCKTTDDTATWTGAAGDGDPANAANWQDSKVPTAATVAIVSGTSLPTKPFTCQCMGLAADISLSANCDWALTSMLFGNLHKIDLKGKELKTSTPWMVGGTITDSTKDTANPGKLLVSVAENVALENASVVLGGNLQFVKDGAGTFISRLTNQNYTGGTIVNTGTIKSIGYENSYYYGKDATPFTINANGILDINGQYSWYRHHIYLNGGEIRNSNGNQTTYSNNALGNITLTDDSTMLLKYHTLVNYKGTSIDLGGHTLTVSHDSGTSNALLTFNNTKVFNGTINLGEDIRFYPYGTTPDFTDATVVMAGSCRLTGDQVVSNLVSNLNKGDPDASLTKKITVTGTFKPVSQYLHNTMLASGAALDLTDKTEPFDVNGSLIASQTISFAEGAITVDVSTRDLVIGTQLVAWDAKPADVAFQWDATTAAKGVALVANAKGIYYGKVVASAEWTNAEGTGDITDPKNWMCYDEEGAVIEDAVPSAASNITIPEDTEITYPAGNREGSFTLQSGATLTIDFGEGKYIEGTALLTSSAGTLDLANGTVIVPGGTYELTPDAKQIRYLPPKVMVARWDFNNYDSENPKSTNVLVATQGEAGVPCYHPGAGSEEIEDLGEMSVTNVIGETGNYAIAIPTNYHVRLPLPKTLQRGDWTIRMRFFTPAASDGKFRTFFSRDNTEDGDLFINKSNLVGGGGKIVPSQKYYGSPVEKEKWHLLTVSQRNGYGAVCVDGEQSYTWTDGSKWNFFFDKDYLYLCADQDGDDGLLFVDYIELDVDTGVWTGEAEDNDIVNPENWQDGYVPYADGVLTADVDLSAEANWTTAGTIAFDNKIIALNGQAITLSALDGTGKVKIDADTVGTLKGGTIKESQLTLNGTLNFDGGSAESPIVYDTTASATDPGKMTLAEGAYVRVNTYDRKKGFDVTGAGASSTIELYDTNGTGQGMPSNAKFRNVTLAVNFTTSGKHLWLENSKDLLDATVNIVAAGNTKFNSYDYTIGTLSGAGEVGMSGTRKLTITPSEDAEYSGTSSMPFIIAAGAGTQTLSGNYTGALTVNEDATVKLAGNANPSSISGAGTVIVAKETISANVSNFTGTFVVEDGVETLDLGTTRPTATFTFEGEATVRYTEVIADDGILHNLTLSGGTTPTYKVYDADGNEKTVTAGKYTPSVSGKAALRAYEFNGNLDNSGSDGTTAMGKDNGPFYDVTSNEVYALTQPHKDITWPGEFTVAIHSTLPDLQNACLVAWGTRDGGGIGLTTGDPARNEVKMVYWPKNTAYTPLATMTVPNAQKSKHLYVFTKTADTLKIYLDGSLVVNNSGAYSLGGGLQVGSVHGGVGNTGLGRLDVVYATKTDTNKCYSVINSMRIYNAVIGPNAMAELVKEFPYESPSGTFTRTLAGEENTWVAEDAWAKVGSEVPYDAPEKGATVNLAASDAASVTLNLDEPVSYEAMNLSGAGTITIAAPADNTNKISCASTAKFGANAVVQYSAMSLAGTPIEIAPGKTLTIDASMIDLKQYFESTAITLTGLVTANDPATQLACTLPAATEHRTVAFVKNESNHTYELKITVDKAVPFVYTIAEDEETGTWTWGDETVDEASVLARSEANIVKQGTGTQSFIGRTKFNYTIDGGILKFTNNVEWVASTITVNKGGAFDLDGNETGSHYNIVLNGGTLANYGEGIAFNKRAIKSITLTDDSFVTTSNNLCFVSDGYTANTLDLGGHTLTKNGSKIFILMNTTVTNGAVVVEKGEIRVNAPSGIANHTVFADDATLELKTGTGLYVNLSSLVLPEITGEGKVKVDTTLVVSNKLDGALAVSGAGKLTLAEGAVLDLAMLEDAYTWPTQIKCAETQTINLNGRESLKLGDKIIAWTAIPEGVTFQWDEETARAGVEPKYEADGLLYGYDPESKVVDKGYWTGAVDGDGKNPANWGCTNKAGYVVADAIPTNAEATVILNGPLTGDCDWTGLGAFVLAQDTLVDLNGHSLAIADFANRTTGIVVTNTVETTGDFVINVPEEKTVQNTTVAILGNVRLVKEGAGTFTGQVKSQSYTGGTLISAGTIKATDYEKYYYLGAKGTDITIETEGTLDLNGWYDWAGHRIVLAGGTLQNTGSSMTHTTYGGLGDVVLTANSKMKLKYHTLFNDNNTARYVDLGGFTLTADFIENSDPKAIVYVNHNTFKNGTFVMNPGIVLRPLTTTCVSGADFTLVVNGDIAPTGTDYTIESVVDNSEGRITDGTHVGTVTKCYKPASTNFQNFVLADGATLDLTAQTEAWSTASALEGKSVTFAENATNTVDVTGRTIEDGDKIIAWTTQPAETTTFAFKGCEGFVASAEADGLYARQAEAKIGDVYYLTFKAALEAVQDGDTLTLLKSIETAEKAAFVINNKDVTLDFGTSTITKTVANDWVFQIAKDADVTFKGTTGGIVHYPGVSNPNNPASMIQILGKLTVEGGEYKSDYTIFKVDEDDAATHSAKGELVVNGGTFTIEEQEGTIYTGLTYAVMNWSKATLNGGTFTGDITTLSNDGNAVSKAGETIVGDDVAGTPVYKLQVTGSTYENVPKIKGVAKASVTLVKSASITDELELVEKDGYVTVQKKQAGPTPAPGSQAEVKPVPGEKDTYYVKPTGESKDILLGGVKSGDTLVVDGQAVDSLGVNAAEGVTVVVTTPNAETPTVPYDITAACKGWNGNEFSAELDATKSVTIGTETIPVTPTAIESEEGTVAEGAVATKAIPGLTYKLMRGTELGTYGTEAAKETATTTTISLKDGTTTKPADKAFYVIEVTK